MPKISNEVIADIVENGADYIEKWGWCRRKLYDWQAVDSYQDYPPACIMGGLMVGNRVKFCMDKQAPLEAIVSKFREAVPEVGAVSAWNDHVCTSQQQALDLMRLAAKRIRIGWEE